MSTPKLDRSRKYGTVYGDSAAKFYQDGLYFNSYGECIEWKDAAQPEKVDSEPLEVRVRRAEIQTKALIEEKKKEAPAKRDYVKEALDGFTPTQEVSTEPPTSKPADEETTRRFEELMELPPTKLRAQARNLLQSLDKTKMSPAEVIRLKGIPAKGEGSKKKNAEFILEYAE